MHKKYNVISNTETIRDNAPLIYQDENPDDKLEYVPPLVTLSDSNGSFLSSDVSRSIAWLISKLN